DAFQGEVGNEPGDFEQWCREMFSRENFDPSLWILLVDGDHLVGTALCRIDSGDEASIGWIDQFGIRRPWRKRGLGLALLYQCFGEFYRRRIVTCGLNVDAENLSGSIRLYERAGMQRVARYEIRYQKAL